jgi:flavin reductase (DIM6/NTAB) family NADH-FMN oxidoreductase RutF
VGINSEIFKRAVGKFPTGVTIISTSYQNTFFGFTANSFTSVSLLPALISFCLDKSASCFHAFSQVGHFAISILAADQSNLSQHFAAPLNNINSKFTNIDHEVGGVAGCPLIIGATCWLECKKYDQITCGDHDIFIGLVENTQINDHKSPLVYFAKSYHVTKILGDPDAN